MCASVLAALCINFGVPALAADDLAAAIRAEGGESKSAAYRFADELTLDIGARLMGSPNMRRAYDWAQAKFTSLGIEGRLEPIGEFGVSWREKVTWVRLSSPDSFPFTARAAPWSASSGGPREAPAIAVQLKTAADFNGYRGRLGGKVVLLQAAEDAKPFSGSVSKRWTVQEVESGDANRVLRNYFARRPERLRERAQREAFNDEIRVFLEQENVAAVVMPDAAEDGRLPGGLTLDNSYFTKTWQSSRRPRFPIAVVDAAQFRRAWRLTERGAEVRIAFFIDTETFGDHEPGYNVVADIPGTDVRLRSEVVLLGAHLDSWAGGTGAVDNAAGVAACLEVVRILEAVRFKPKRTVRIVLYGGEEQGLLGARSYVETHLKDASGKQLPAYGKLVVAYNLDGGSGRIRGIYSGGNARVAHTHRRWIQGLRDLDVHAVYDEPDWPADQSAFTDAGLPGVSFLQDPLDYDSIAHHSVLDTIERVSAQDLAQVSTVLALLIATAASDADALQRMRGPDDPASR